MYTVTHQFLTVGDRGEVIFRTVVLENIYIGTLADKITEELDHPGGTSGTTISLTAHLIEDLGGM